MIPSIANLDIRFNNYVHLYKHLKYVYICDSFVFRKMKENGEEKMVIVGSFGPYYVNKLFEDAGWKRASERAEHLYFNPIGTVE